MALLIQHICIVLMWFFSVVFIFLLVSLHYYVYRKSFLKRFYWLALFAKLFSGLLLYEVYKHFYALGDMSLYWIDAVRLSDFFEKDPINYLYFVLTGKLSPTWEYVFATKGERAFFFVRYLSLLCLLAVQNAYLVCVLSSLFAFIGLWACANELVIFFKKFTSFATQRIEWAAAVAFFFVPSVAFWASSMMKESLLWLLMGFLMAFWLQLLQTIHDKGFREVLRLRCAPKVVVLFVMLYLLLQLKYYYFAVLAPLLVAYTSVFLWARATKLSIQLSVFLALFIGFVAVVSNLHPNLWLSRLAEAIYLNQNHILENSPLENQLPFVHRAPTLWSMLYNAPLALFSGLFLPLHTERFNPLKIFAILENWVLLVLFVQTLRRKNFTLHALVFKTNFMRLFWWTGVLFCLLMATLLALAAPNVGSLVRYKIGFLPFWVFGILLRIN